MYTPNVSPTGSNGLNRQTKIPNANKIELSSNKQGELEVPKSLTWLEQKGTNSFAVVLVQKAGLNNLMTRTALGYVDSRGMPHICGTVSNDVLRTLNPVGNDIF